jgi:putative ABC transport system ATP-binding protein
MIELKKLKKSYRMGSEMLSVLNGIDLTIKTGEFVAITGPSGSGKSTLMNILGCLDRPSEGSYLLDGRETAKLTMDQLAVIRNRTIGFVFQNFNLLPRISALYNVALPGLYAGLGKKERLARAEEMVDAVGLAERMYHRPNELSGGQRQRVAIARALFNDPPLLIADEPTGNLDSRSSEEIMKIFSRLHKAGRTLILVTHEAEIAAYAERVIQVRDGKIVNDERRKEEEHCSERVS